MWSGKSRQKTEFNHADLLASLIDNDNFWLFARHANGEADRMPDYIRTLKEIAGAYERLDLYQDPQIARQFLEACFHASGPELEIFESDKNNLPEDYVAMDANPLAKKLYRALRAAEKGDYQQLETMVDFYKKYLIWDFMGVNHLISHNSTTIDKLAESYAAFKKRIAKADKPEFLILYEFIIHTGYHETTAHKTKKEYMKKEGKWESLFLQFIVIMENYVITILDKNPSLFFEYFGNAKNLAYCLRQDSYGICFYDKHGKADVVQINSLDHFTVRRMRDHLDSILLLAFKDKNAGKFFKSAEDIYTFLDILTKHKTPFSIGLPSSKRNIIVEFEALLIKGDKKLLKMIGVSKLAPEIYKLAPGIEKYCKAAAAYSHAGYGLMGAKKIKKREGSGHPITQLPTDVVKIIANETDKLMKKELNKEEKPEKPKSPSKS